LFSTKGFPQVKSISCCFLQSKNVFSELSMTGLFVSVLVSHLLVCFCPDLEMIIGTKYYSQNAGFRRLQKAGLLGQNTPVSRGGFSHSELPH
jgi:hypothetical protein